MKLIDSQASHPQAGSILAGALYAQLQGSPVLGSSVQQGLHGSQGGQELNQE